MDNRTKKKNFRKSLLGKDRAGYFFILPAMIVLLAFTIIPVFCSFFISLTDLDIFLASPDFTGIENFIRSFGDSRVWNAFKNTLVFTVFSVPIQMVFSLLLAFLLYKSTRFNKMCRSVYYIPVLCSFTAIGIMFSLILNSTVGYIPYIISWFNGGKTVALLSDENWALPIIIFIAVWKQFGKTMIILVAGINDIPETYREAAKIDGATNRQQFFKVVLPLLLPSINFTLITNIISAFQVFDVVYVTTGGGPQFKTETIVQYIYEKGFQPSYELGYASALSVELFVVIAIIVFIFKGVIEKRINETY